MMMEPELARLIVLAAAVVIVALGAILLLR